jgi:hypothetical protein
MNDNKNLFADLAIGAITGVLLVKLPATRLIAAFVAVIFGLLWVWAGFLAMAGSTGYPNFLCLLFGVGCFGIAWMLIRWYRQEVHATQPAVSNYAAMQTPEGIARLTQGSVMTQGPALGYRVQVVSVDESSIRAADGQVWANADLILSNGAAQPATFHASAPATPMNGRPGK